VGRVTGEPFSENCTGASSIRASARLVPSSAGRAGSFGISPTATTLMLTIWIGFDGKT
jgi:hypothetical protein